MKILFLKSVLSGLVKRSEFWTIWREFLQKRLKLFDNTHGRPGARCGIRCLVAHACRTRTPSAIGIRVLSIAMIFFCFCALSSGFIGKICGFSEFAEATQTDLSAISRFYTSRALSWKTAVNTASNVREAASHMKI